MDSTRQIDQHRLAILADLKSIRSLRRGTITEQFFLVRHKGQKEPVRQGPYYVFSRREGQKTVSHRLTSAQALEQARQDVAAFKRFQALCRDYEQATEKLGELERAIVAEKKTSKSESNKTGK